MNVVNIPDRKSDAELAGEFRERLKKALGEVTEILTEANKAGLMVNFQIGNDVTGRSFVAQLDILKKL